MACKCAWYADGIHAAPGYLCTGPSDTCDRSTRSIEQPEKVHIAVPALTLGAPVYAGRRPVLANSAAYKVILHNRSFSISVLPLVPYFHLEAS